MICRDGMLLDAPAPVAGDALELDVRIVAWDTPASVTDDGRTRYTEIWERGSLIPRADGVMPVYAGHVPTPAGIAHGELVGRLDNVYATDDGLYGTVVLADTPAARTLHALARTVGATVSLEGDPGDVPAPRPGGTVTRTATAPTVLTGAAVLTLPTRGAIPGAAVLAVRADPDPDPVPATHGVPAMSDDPTTPTPDPTPDPTDPPDPEARIARGEVDEMIRRAMVRVPQGAGPVAHPLARYGSFAAFADDAYHGGSAYSWSVSGGQGERPLAAQLARAWLDQITTDNPGVMPPAWITDVFGIVERSRAVIDGIGTRPLPDSGMDLNWPYFDGDLSTLVGEQLAQKTEITSVKVSLKKGTEAIRSFAGGSDLSYQLIRRSSPSYRDTYLRIMSAAYAITTDKAAAVDLTAAATGGVEMPLNPTPDDFRAAIFEASVDVELATGTPATVVLAATDAFVKWGSTLLPAAYGTNNVSGTADASSLAVNVSGLRIVHAPNLAAGTILVTNGQAAFWAEDGPMVISAPDVPRLGEDTAIWGMGALAVPVPAGVVEITTAIAAARTAKS